ncbi:hypothetical protein JTE90_007662 [Oedothorax gibbosus]|uniref:BEN domain-containing protein n=1 Tax=Oedothorax gibbosus TaxID=931172 RepID=A0AAV6TQM1_9ARAC|nr:hypothetical protein JTE90_007662 [Oedothorax gibbosus]
MTASVSFFKKFLCFTAVAEPSLSFLETFLPSSQPEGIIEKFQIDPSKLEMAKKVKAGEPGDSLYIKNLAVVVWGKQELANRSVCGFRCNAKKKSVARKALTPEKLGFIKDKFKERISAEGVGAAEIEKRMSKLNKFICEKIITLNRNKNVT